MIASVMFDGLTYLVKRDALKRDLHAAGYYTLLLGALASLVGVLSGLMITAWQFFGEGLLAKHHDFVWPAFLLMIALAGWRLAVRNDVSRMPFGLYLIIAAVAAILMAASGYFGGELLGGGEPAQTAQNAPPPASPQGAALTPVQLVASGQSLYGQFCANCHGAQAEGKRGPSLHKLGDPDAKIARNIANGFPGAMPAYKNKLRADQIQALVAYIQSLK